MNNFKKIIIVIALALTQFAFAAIYYVDADTSGANWYSETNFSFDLSTALSSAASGDTIFVAKGTYTATTSFALVSGVKMYGGFTGGETSLTQRTPKINETILHAGGSNPVVTGSGATITSSTVIDGFVIESGSVGAGNGGGMNLETSASPSVSNCIIRSNSATLGGGVYIAGAAAPTFDKCLFKGNSATDVTNGGGAIYALQNSNSTFTINLSTFVDNVAPVASAIMSGNKNTISADSCVFWNNADASSTLNPFGASGAGVINVSNYGSDNVTNATTSGSNETYSATPFAETTYYCLKSTQTYDDYGWITGPSILDICLFLEGSMPF